MNLERLPAGSEVERDRAGRRAARALAAGGILVHPTETVYGIGGDGTVASNRFIARVKRRPPEQPLLLLTPDLRALHRFLPEVEWPEAAERLAARFWPGPLTLIVPCRSAPQGLVGPGGGVAVRVSPHPCIAAIFRYWRHPITSTSANASGNPPAHTVDEALGLFEDRDDLAATMRPLVALDAGRTPGAAGSTLVSLVRRPPAVVRPGPIEYDELREVLSELRPS